MERKDGESFLSYCKRLTSLIDSKTIGYTEYGDGLLGAENCYSSENIRKFFYIFKKILEKLDDNVEISEESIKDEIERMKYDLLVEQKKVQRLNREHYENARIDADTRLYYDMINDSVQRLQPIKIEHFPIKEEKESIGILIISDEHYGKEFTMFGLHNEIINQYSPEIFKERMWKLLSRVEKDYSTIKYNKLKVLDCGDNIEGILRCTSTLRKLKVGVIDSAYEYAEFLATWICELYNRLHIPIEYSVTGGNHDIIRLLGQKKDFADENLARDVQRHIRDRVKISKLEFEKEYGYEPNIKVEEYGEELYCDALGTKILSYHGDSKNMKDDIRYFENYYNIDIDIIIGGHLHNKQEETLGFGSLGDKEMIRVPSIVGVEDFSKTIRRCSKAGAKFMTFTKQGKNWEKTYLLN